MLRVVQTVAHTVPSGRVYLTHHISTNKMCIKCIQSMHDRKHVPNTSEPLRPPYLAFALSFMAL